MVDSGMVAAIGFAEVGNVGMAHQVGKVEQQARTQCCIGPEVDIAVVDYTLVLVR